MIVTVPGTSAVWLAGGIVPLWADLTLSGAGTVEWDPGTANAGGVAIGDFIGNPADLPVSDMLVNGYGCGVLLLPIGASPNNGIQYASNVIGFPVTSPVTVSPVTASYSMSQLRAACDPGNQGPWQLWYRPNDDDPANNTGSWTITESVTIHMSRYLFSTGLFVASLPLPACTVTRQVKGTPAAATLSLTNLADNDVTTLVDLPITDTSDFTYLSLDYGASQAIGRVSAYNVTMAGGGASLKCYASATAITTGDFSGATAIPASITPTTPSNDWEFQPAGGYGTSVAARYIYIVPSTGATSCTLGDVDARSTEYVIAAVQNIAVNVKYKLVTVKEAATITLYPAADAMTGGSMETQPEFVDLNKNGIQMFTGAQLSVVSLSDVITHGGTAEPLPFVGELITSDTQGRPVRVIGYHTFAPGFTWSMKIEDFASLKFNAVCRMPNASSSNAGRVWRMIFGQ